MSRGVFVLGMHRSGTSAATRLVNLLGIPTCIEEDLLPGTDDNPRGYWESGSLTAFNDRILEAFESDWSCPPRLDPAWEADLALAELRSEAGTLFSRVFPVEPWVWKDPRNCITLPFWKESLDVEHVVVLVHRNPLEIAASLGARDDLGKVYCLALWERYLRLALAGISGLPTLVTDYAKLVSEPLAWCELVRTFLHAQGVVTSAPPEGEALAFVDERLRHTRFSAADLAADRAVTEAQKALFLALQDLRGSHESLSPPVLPDETPSTEALLAERRRAHGLERDLTRQYLELEDYARRLGERFILLAERSGSMA